LFSSPHFYFSRPSLTRSSVIGQAAALLNAPGYTRNSSTLLWCTFDQAWMTVVVFGTAAIDEDLTVRLIFEYVGSYLKFGRVFIANELVLIVELALGLTHISITRTRC
jgi:hypothetical protein